MAQVTEHQVLEVLRQVREPESGEDIVSRGMVSGVVVRDGNVGFAIEVDPRRGPKLEPMRAEAERIVMEDMPVAFVYHRIAYILVHDWVGNFKPNAYKADCMGGGFAKYYTIDTEKRRRYWEQYK